MDEVVRSGFRIGDRLVEPTLCRIVNPEGAARVEPRVMDVLVTLAKRAGEMVSRDELIRAVWKHPHVTDEALTRCVSLLRQALGDDREHPRFLETIPKRGYRLLLPVTAVSPATRPAGAPISLAVLPTLNLSGDSSDEYLADGITELLIANLARLPGLRVISRTSSMHYKGTPLRLTDIARELDVARVIEGSVLRFGKQLQIVIQLIDPATDAHLLSRSYTREFVDILRLQNEIAWTIAEEIGGTLRPAERERLPAIRAIDERATQAYLRARFFWAQRSPESFQKAIREYESCIAIEGNFALAYAGLADTLITMSLYGIAAPGPLFARARELSQRALALEPMSAETLTTGGGIKFFFEWDFDAAEALMRRAIELNPSYDIARLGLADILCCRRDFDAALGELHVAVRVNPFDLGLQMNLGQFLMLARRHESAVTQLLRTLEMGPHFWPARCLLAETYAILGDGAAAHSQLERVREDIPVARVFQPEAFVHAALGETDRALSLLKKLEATRDEHYIPPWELARGYAALGDADAAFRWIDMGIAERGPTMLTLGVYSGFDRIRDDPRFAERLARIGLPP